MSDIDNRVISLNLDDSKLQAGAGRVSSILSKLTETLKMKSATSGIDNIDKAANGVKLSGIQSAVESVNNKFSTMRLVAINALGNITSRAISAGASIAKSLTIAPVIDGFHEYETQMNSVQTILANTASKGSTIKDVNKALAELNTYADKTIYNFTEMTRNIGTFTAAGVDLRTSVESIKGIANLAAVSGSSSMQASTAMYQLSQAIASGTVKLMDWNSVVNAGMGGEVFQKALERTSEHLKTGATAAIKAKGSFRESLQEGWLTTKVLTETLKQFQLSVDTATQYDNTIKTLVSQGYTQQQAKAIADMAKTAGDAATKVKTFSQLMDTLKEAVGSGWTNTFQTLFGDFEEARQSWTALSNILGDIVSNSATARNTMLQGWANLGGRKELFGIFTDSLKLIMSYLGPIKQGFRDIFPPMTSKTLFNITKGLHDFIKVVTLSESQMAKLRKAIGDILSPLGLIRDAFKAAFSIIPHDTGIAASGIELLINVLSALGSGIRHATDFIRMFGSSIGKGFGGLKNLSPIFDDINTKIKSFIDKIKDAFGSTNVFASFGPMFSKAGQEIGKGLNYIIDIMTKSIDWISNNIKLGDVLKVAITGGFIGLIHKIMGFLDSAEELVEKITGIFKKGEKGAEEIKKGGGIFSGVIDQLKVSISAFTNAIKAHSLLEIAIAIGVLAYAMKQISSLNVGQVVVSLGAMAAMFGLLSGGLKKMTKILSGFEGSGILKAGFYMIMLAKAIEMLSKAVVMLSKLDPFALAQGVLAVSVMIKVLARSLKSAAINSVSLSTSVALIAMAKSVQMLTKAIVVMSKLSWEGIGKGLAGVGGALIELSVAMKIMNKVKVPLKTSIAILAMAKSMQMIGEALVVLAKLSWEGVAKGLTAMGGTMVIMTGVLKILGTMKPRRALASAASVYIVAKSLVDIAKAFEPFKSMTMEDVAKGIVGLGGALSEVTGVLYIIGKMPIRKSLAAAASLKIVISSLAELSKSLAVIGSLSWSGVAKGLSGLGGALSEMSAVLIILGKLGGMVKNIGSATAILIASKTLSEISAAMVKIGALSWSGVAKGLTGIGGALTELGAVIGILGSIAPVGSVVGAVGILVAVQSLDKIANALGKIGKLSWGEVGRGLTGMGGALTELGLVISLLGTFAPIGSIVGGAGLLMGVQSLNKLAVALVKIGKMSWSQVGRGLSGMGGALTELGAVIGIIGTVAPVGAIAGAYALNKAIEPLGKLAKAFEKFGSLTWNEIDRGLKGLGGALSQLAGGTFKNTFGIIGSMSIEKVAEPLGVLAHSVGLWANVKVPANLKDQMKTVSDAVSSMMWMMGSGSLKSIAVPMGQLADSMNKWTSVTVPPNFKENMWAIKDGVSAFGFNFLSGPAIGAIVGPFGDLAASVKKWSGIKFNPGIKQGLWDIKDGVSSFALQFTAGGNLGGIVGPLGDLAASVNKWKDVKFNPGLKKGLWELKDGIGAFSLQFTSGFNIGNLIKPLSELPAALSKWKDVELPKGLKKNLWEIKDGLAAFGKEFFTGINIGNIAKPMYDLARATKAWDKVKLPDGFKQTAWGIKDGLGAFSGQFFSGINLGNLVKPMTDLGSAVRAWGDTKVPKSFKTDVWAVKDGLAAFNTEFTSGFNLGNIVQPMKDLAQAATAWAGVKVSPTFKTDVWAIKDGLAAFNTEFTSGFNLGNIVQPMKDLASAANVWNGVKLNPGFKQMAWDIKDGLAAFNTEFTSGFNLGNIVGPMGALANGVKTWNGVKLPSNFKQDAWDIKDGLAAFSTEFTTGWNLGNVVGPMGALANAVKTWNGVKLPSNFVQDAWNIKDGLGAFSTQFTTGWNLGNIVGPMGALANAVKTWNGVKLVSNFKQDVIDIKDGLGSFTWASFNTNGMNAIIQPMKGLAGAAKSWNGVLLPASFEQNMDDISSGMTKFNGVGAGVGTVINSVTGPIKNLASSMKAWSVVGDTSGFGKGLGDIQSAVSKFGSIGDSAGNIKTATAALLLLARASDIILQANLVGTADSLGKFVTGYNGVASLNSGVDTALSDTSNAIVLFSTRIKTVQFGSISMIGTAVGQIKSAIDTLNSINIGSLGAFKTAMQNAGDLGLAAFATSVSANSSTISTGLNQLGMNITMGQNVIVTALGALTTGVQASLSNFGTNLSSQFYLANSAISSGTLDITVSLQTLASIVTQYATQIPTGLSGMASGISAQMLSASVSVSAGTIGITSAMMSMATLMSVYAAAIPATLAGMAYGVGAQVSAVSSAIYVGSGGIGGALGIIASTMRSYAIIIPSSFSGASSGVRDQLSAVSNAISVGGAAIQAGFSMIASTMRVYASQIPATLAPVPAQLSQVFNSALNVIRNFRSGFESAGNQLMTALTSGVSRGSQGVQQAATSGMNGTVSALRGFRSGFEGAGEYVAQGFANGIQSGSNAAIQAAYDMGAKAIAAAKKATDEHSPSKLAFKIGDYLGVGMKNGIVNATDDVISSAYAMGSDTISALNDSIGKGASLSPSITPVIDMSSFKSNASSISDFMTNSDMSLFTGNISVPDITYKDPRVTALASYQNQMVETNSKMMNKLDTMNDNLTGYTNALENQEVAMYLDGRKLASSQAKYNNQELGKLSRRGEVR